VKAAILHELGRPFVIEDVDLSNPAPNEVRVRLAASGLCHSDYHYVTGDLACPVPALLGHETSGVVEAVGENVRHVKPGDRVVASQPYCGRCGECETGHTHRCDDLPTRIGPPRVTLRGQPVFQFVNIGGFAESVLVDGSGVAKVPEAMPLDLAALLGCAVITGVGAVLNTAKVRPGQSVAVIGCGGVGLNVIQGAKIAGASRIVAVDVNPAKLELARQFGATDLIRGGADADQAVVEATKGGVDYAFEVIGLTETMRQAFLMLRKGGAAVLIGVPKAGAELSLPFRPAIMKELRVLSSLMGSAPVQSTIAALSRFYLDGALKLEPLVSQRIGLADINRGYDQLAAGEVARCLITFDA
jgi:S-(hydroxymethyl)glutathione dehydrogenase/alcohol dehydrogenase